MREEIGIGIVRLECRGQLHSRGYRRLFNHYAECEATQRLIIAATVDDEVGAGV